jgi:hypothetical protein
VAAEVAAAEVDEEPVVATAAAEDKKDGRRDRTGRGEGIPSSPSLVIPRTPPSLSGVGTREGTRLWLRLAGRDGPDGIAPVPAPERPMCPDLIEARTRCMAFRSAERMRGEEAGRDAVPPDDKDPSVIAVPADAPVDVPTTTPPLLVLKLMGESNRPAAVIAADDDDGDAWLPVPVPPPGTKRERLRCRRGGRAEAGGCGGTGVAVAEDPLAAATEVAAAALPAGIPMRRAELVRRRAAAEAKEEAPWLGGGDGTGGGAGAKLTLRGAPPLLDGCRDNGGGD